MESIAIETAENAAAVYNRLKFEYSVINCPVTIERFDRQGQVAFVCVLTENPDSTGSSREWFVRSTANAVSDLIVNEWEGSLLSRLIKSRYSYFSAEEIAMISHQAKSKLPQPPGSREDEQFYKVRQKEKIMGALLEYLGSSQHINIEGFIAFRLKDYRQQMIDAIDGAVDDFFLEREYSEFIRLLRYFVSIQEPRAEAVHVLLSDTGYFQVFNGEGQAIDCDYPAEADEPGSSGVNYEDLLVSALISLAPQKITIHFPGEAGSREITTTVRDVFGSRVSICHACALCKPRTGETALLTRIKSER